jgi:Tol biopolymer transport system component
MQSGEYGVRPADASALGRTVARFAATAAALLGLACSADSIGPGGRRAAGISIVAGDAVVDTVLATPRQPLVVEVHDSIGATVPSGTVVRLTGVPHGAASGVEMTLDSVATQSFVSSLALSTDSTGRVSAPVRLGPYAGTARIAIAVPALGLLDTARYTVQPGAASKVMIAPTDTGVSADGTFAYRGGITDQFGNIRPDRASWSASTPGLALSNTGLVTPSALGRYTITVTGTIVGTSRSSTAMVSVLPNERLVEWSTASPSGLSLVDVTGAHSRFLASLVDGGIGAHPMWLPDGSGIIYTAYVGLQQLEVVDTLGVIRTFFPNGIPNVTHQADPTPTADGKWVYFGAYDGRCSTSAYCLYRSRIDGSAPELLGTAATSSYAVQPAPSPDGSRVAFVTGGSTIRVMDVGAGTVSTWGEQGGRPAWSPDGTQIAFLSPSGTIMLMHPDDTALRALTPNTRFYGVYPISWTPDGKFLWARNTNGAYELVDAQTGGAIPAPALQGAKAVNVKP